MADFNALDPVNLQLMSALAELRECNNFSSRFGLALSEEQIKELVEGRFSALKDTGRIEFGEGVLKKLVFAFCDSPYVIQDNYDKTIFDLQEAFYYFKNESNDQISDDELIEYMKFVFDGRAQGSAEYLTGTSLEDLCRYAREEDNRFDANNLGDLF